MYDRAMTRLRTLTLLVGLAVLSWGAAKADGGPTVVELFTSQSCYSCPPAEAFLGELAGRDGILALEFHVDYWNSLIYGAAGKWADPFSSPAYTERQRVYAQTIPRGRVYTPQMVIDGRMEAVGSRRGAVDAAILAARKAPRAGVRLAATPAGGLEIAVDAGAEGQGVVWLVRFLNQRSTKILRGENKGKTLTNHHIVTELRRIGAWSGAPLTLELPELRLAAGEGCAVLVQADGQGPILGAAICPRLDS